MIAPILTLLYGSEKAIMRGLRSIVDHKHPLTPVYAINQHYPLWQPHFVDFLQQEFDIKILDAGKNLGIVGGTLFMLDNIPYTDNVILMDCDAVISTYNFDRKLSEVCTGDVVWATCFNNAAMDDMVERAGYHVSIINGHRCWVPHSAVINTTSAHNRDWLKANLVQENAYYGGSEASMFPRLGNKRWVFVEDVIEIAKKDLPFYDDEVYLQYKIAHARGAVDHRYKGSFDEYLKHINYGIQA